MDTVSFTRSLGRTTVYPFADGCRGRRILWFKFWITGLWSNSKRLSTAAGVSGRAILGSANVGSVDPSYCRRRFLSGNRRGNSDKAAYCCPGCHHPSVARCCYCQCGIFSNQPRDLSDVAVKVDFPTLILSAILCALHDTWTTPATSTKTLA